MLFTIAVIFLIAWMLGLVGVYTVGAVFHLLLVVAIVLFLVGLLTGRSIAWDFMSHATAKDFAGEWLMTLLLLLVFLLVGALGSLLAWSPRTKWSYAPTAVCSVLAVVIALLMCWSAP
jgi:hypothetical protein